MYKIKNMKKSDLVIVSEYIESDFILKHEEYSELKEGESYIFKNSLFRKVINGKDVRIISLTPDNNEDIYNLL